MASRSTRVSWITLWVQWRFSKSRPPKAFFIAPVICVNTWVFMVGKMNDVRSDEPLGNPNAFGIDLVEHQHLGLGLVVNPLLALSYRWILRRPYLSTTTCLCLFASSPRLALTTTVRL